MNSLVLFGLGRSGLAVAARCQRLGIPFAFYDEHAPRSMVAEAVAAGGTELPTVTGVHGTIIAAPGVPWDHPLLEAARANGAQVIGEVEWVANTSTNDMVGVTGTAGKGSVTAWLTHVLTKSGIPATAGGNIDPALSAVVSDQAGILVTELSSFQLERSPTLAPRLRILLNLGEDHLDRHYTKSAYHEVKLRLLNNLGPDDVVILNADDDELMARAQHVPRAQRRLFSLERGADAYVDANDVIKLYGEALLHVKDVPLPGRHQVANALAVIVAAAELGLDHDEIANTLVTFPGLPGRFATVTTRNGVTYYTDSIATRPLAVQAALQSAAGPVVWLAGGRSKGASLAPLHSVVREKVALLVGFGESGPAFANAFANDTNTVVVTGHTGEESVRAAVAAAEQYFAGRGTGGSIVFAPLGTSFDQFTDFTERQDVFIKAVLGQ